MVVAGIRLATGIASSCVSCVLWQTLKARFEWPNRSADDPALLIDRRLAITGFMLLRFSDLHGRVAFFLDEEKIAKARGQPTACNSEQIRSARRLHLARVGPTHEWH
jgi:hypothetical protein